MEPNAEPRIVTLPKIEDERGNLSFIQHGQACPFEMARVYWVYDMPAGGERDGHAFRTATELIVAMSGSVDVVTDSACGHRVFHLDRPWQALLVPPMTWRSIGGFTSAAAVMVLSSTPYDEADYVRSRQVFNSLIGTNAPDRHDCRD